MSLTVSNNSNARTASWVTGDGSITEAGVDFGSFNDRTVTVTGTFGGATITIQGSNDNSTYQTLRSTDGANLTFTAAGIRCILEAPKYIRITSTAGSSASVTTIVHATGGQ